LSLSLAQTDGFASHKDKISVEKLEKKQGWRQQIKRARASESDRHVFDQKPKHLFSGKRGIGSTDRR
jgi:nucleolar GTP-binding protein